MPRSVHFRVEIGRVPRRDRFCRGSGEAARELRWIEDRARELFPGAHVALTGAISQYTVAQDYVSYGQIKSLGAAFAVVTVLMMIVFT